MDGSHHYERYPGRSIATAFMGQYGEEGPVLGFLGEFDALPELSQEAGCTQKKPVEGKTCGHGCDKQEYIGVCACVFGGCLVEVGWMSGGGAVCGGVGGGSAGDRGGSRAEGVSAS